MHMVMRSSFEHNQLVYMYHEHVALINYCSLDSVFLEITIYRPVRSMENTLHVVSSWLSEVDMNEPHNIHVNEG